MRDFQNYYCLHKHILLLFNSLNDFNSINFKVINKALILKPLLDILIYY